MQCRRAAADMEAVGELPRVQRDKLNVWQFDLTAPRMQIQVRHCERKFESMYSIRVPGTVSRNLQVAHEHLGRCSNGRRSDG
jgi:hypothetical protein